MTIEVMKQALEALEAHADIGIKSDKAITALRTAIAEAKSVEPVAWQGVHDKTDLYYRKPPQADVRPLYTTPQPQQAEKQEPVAYTTGHCKEKAQPGGCQLHNLHCGYPDCDRKAVETPPAAQRKPHYDKTEMNCFVQNLYDQKMREGKRGHYETMFHVVHRAIEAAHGITGEKT